MSQAAGNQFANMMDSDQLFETILTSFEITQRATNRLTEDYVTANDLMASNVEHIKSVARVIFMSCVGVEVVVIVMAYIIHVCVCSGFCINSEAR